MSEWLGSVLSPGGTGIGDVDSGGLGGLVEVVLLF